MRKKIVAGNWKMNTNLSEADVLTTALMKGYDRKENTEVVIAPPFTHLYHLYELTRTTNIEVAAQNMHQASKGAYTGEISADMLKSVGIKTVILGHSERRAYFHEGDQLLAEKVSAALKEEMKVIFCFGEELEDRQKKTHFNLVESQLKEGLFHIAIDDWQNIVLAYEPVWAIGTGETASPEQAQEMHAFIRKTIAEAYDQTIADHVSILYGGSVKPANAKEIFSKPDVDGGLIGGASLKAEDFLAIIAAI
ncbi:triose-phosphate isomerase [Gangjinia marincola]|uniref:Triosephosphate isomerase n=1 Tax=Gangjinia marincola TaxID=578463 RepID=A0ABN1MJR2_9FLAO